MKNKTRIERLNATLYLAESVPAELLNQHHWTCKTTHCIAGWCGKSPWHQSRGMSLDSVGCPVYGRRGEAFGTESFADFHGITTDEAFHVTIMGNHLRGEAARANVTEKLKALIVKYGGEVMYS